jgi:hypothetical protein
VRARARVRACVRVCARACVRVRACTGARARVRERTWVGVDGCACTYIYGGLLGDKCSQSRFRYAYRLDIVRTNAYIRVMSHDIDEMVAMLDPDRDYGERTFDDVVKAVRDGSISASPGHPVPMLRIGAMSVKGSGAPVALANATKQRPWLAKFEERASTDFDAVYESLLTSAINGEVKAQMYFLDRLLGKPRETRDGGNSEMLSAFIGALAGTRMVDIEPPETISSLRIIDPLE